MNSVYLILMPLTIYRRKQDQQQEDCLFCIIIELTGLILILILTHAGWMSGSNLNCFIIGVLMMN